MQMKTKLLFRLFIFQTTLLVIFYLNDATAQVPTGTSCQSMSYTDIDGNNIHLNWLTADGIEVILFFGDASNAADWQYLQTNILQDYYSDYGPDGAGTATVLYIEVNQDTGIDYITGDNPLSQGDYTSLVNFPIVNSAPWAISFFELDTYPTIYRLCTSNVLELLDEPSYEELVNPAYEYCSWTDTIQNAILTDFIAYSYCGGFSVSYEILNLGVIPLTECEIQLSTPTGLLETIPWSGYLDTGASIQVGIQNLSVPYETQLTAQIISGDAIPNEPLTSPIYFTTQASEHIRIEATLSDNMIDVGWVLYDENYNELVVVNDIDLTNPDNYIQDLYTEAGSCYEISLQGTAYMYPNTPSITHFSISSVHDDGSTTPILTLNGDWNSPPNAGIQVTEPSQATVSGFVFLDENENGLLDEVDQRISGIEVHADDLITYTDVTGYYEFPNQDIANHEIYVVYDATIYPSHTTDTSYTIMASDIYNRDFGLNTNESIFDAEFVASTNLYICGLHGELNISIENTGNTPIDATFTAIFSDVLNIFAVLPTPTSFDGNAYTWHFDNIPLGQIQYLSIHTLFPGYELMGQSITNEYTLTLFDEFGNIINNTNTTNSSLLLCSFDPNDKTVTPSGASDAHYVPLDTPLEYLIRFQNTGNYLASNIHVKDTLDNNLDLNTLNVIQTSHYCLPTVNANTREVDFFFPNIALADSASNEPESHGFIHYRISPVENIQEMTKVNNNADIYFDFNPAIITNTTWTTFSDLFFSVKETQQTFTPIIYPNPASDLVTIQFPADFNSGDISILDLQGRRVAHLQNITGSIITYSLSNLSAGNYVIKTHSNDKIIFHPIKLCVVK